MPDINEDSLSKDFLEMVRELAPTSGLDHLSGTIIGILYLEPEELSLEELVQKTGYSKASISQKIKVLVTMGIIRRRNKPGSRKVYLYMEKNIFTIWKEQMKRHFMPEIRIMKKKIPELIEKYTKSAASPMQQKRIEILANYNMQIIQLEILLNKFYEEFDKTECNVAEL